MAKRLSKILANNGYVLPELRRGPCPDKDMVEIGVVEVRSSQVKFLPLFLKKEAKNIGATIVYERSGNIDPDGLYLLSGKAYRPKTQREYARNAQSA